MHELCVYIKKKANLSHKNQYIYKLSEQVNVSIV